MRLTKHHGLGNDFLVVLGDESLDASVARALCDRHRGIGADGLIRGVMRDGTLTMTLWNADGSEAEMSGNGIRCLAQAEAMRRGVTDLDIDVATAAGMRHVDLRPGPDERTAIGSVDMGPATEGPVLALEGAARPKLQQSVDVGNPHLVQLFEDIDTRDLAATGGRPELNVEFVTIVGDTIDMRVIERGVGETQACGTGACAAAWAAHEWGLVGERVAVHMPGGDVDVVLGDSITLIGPVTYIVAVEV